jgi:hypothetical protein
VSTGQKVIKRLFLDGIHAKTTGSTIGGEDDFVIPTGSDEDDFVIPTGSDETESVLTLSESAETRAEVTLQATIAELMPVSSGNSAYARFLRNYRLLPGHRHDIGVMTSGRNGPGTVFLRM